MASGTGHGASIIFQSGLVAEPTSFAWSMSRDSIATTNMSTTTRMTYIPRDIADAGELTVECNLDDQAEAWADVVEKDAENITLTFPGSGTWAASGFVTGADFSLPDDGLMTATLTIKFTGDITTA